MIHQIDDATDPRLAQYRNVGDPAALDRRGLFVAEGRLVAERLLEDGWFDLHSVAVTPAALEPLRPLFRQQPSIAVYVCEPSVLQAITGFNFHRGCVALAYRTPRTLTLDEAATATCVLALEGVTNPDNVGGLFRTALAFGVDAVLLDDASADPLYRKAIRTSMAASLRLPFVRVDPWLDGLETLRAAGLRVVALTPHPDATPLADYAAHADERIAVLVGSEGFGLGRESLQRADVRVRIAIDPRADSLNVVTAAAIALHALRNGDSPRFGGGR